jgi:hypothetical protein
MPADKLANYRQTTSKTVDGLSYTVVSRADISRDSSGIVACQADSAASEYFKTKSTVTWAGMKNVDPLVVESLVSPGVGALANGSLTVKLQRADGGPQPGIGVTAGSANDVTDAGGCAVFALLSAGSIDVTWNTAGYVDKLGNQSITKTTTVSANSTANVVDAYDRAATVPVQFKDAATVANGSWPTLSATNTGYGATVRTWGSGSPPGTTSITATNLFPFPTNYGFYAGNCTGNDPTAYNSNYYGAAPGSASSVLTSPGATSPLTTAYTRAVNLTVRKNGTDVTKFRYKITPDTMTVWTATGGTATGKIPMAGCTENVSGSASGATDTAALPWGLYTICVDDNRGGGSTRRRYVSFVNTPTTTPVPSAQNQVLDVGTTGSSSGSC